MTQVYGEDGVILPVTVIEAGPCTVLQIRSPERDGYSAVQVGYDDKLSDADKERSPDRRNRKRASKAERGHVKKLQSARQKSREAAGVAPVPKAECEPKRFIREFRTDGDAGCEVGQELTVSLFDGVDRVDVVGTNKGRGTSGAMKRHNFSGQPASHGAKKVHRRVGGIGAHATNRGTSGRISKGKRMAGRYGNARITVRNLKLVKVDPENHLLLVCGAIPGPNGGYVMIRKTNKVG